MIITKKQRERMDRSCPLFDKDDVEFTHVEEPIFLVYEITTGATSGLEIFKDNAPFKFEILDVFIQCRGTDATGTMKLADGEASPNDITDALACEVDTTIARAMTINDAYSIVKKDGSLQVICAGTTVANVKALVTVVIREVD